MRKVLFIFGQLTDGDVEWIARNGKRKRLPASTVLIQEGVPVETLYILLEGELAVVRGSEKRQVARLGSGEIVGEMSFIDAHPPNATVLAATEVVVCAIPKRELARGLEKDVAFAARFYKAVATFLADRVRQATARQDGAGKAAEDELDDSVLDNIDRAGARFDSLTRTLLDG